MKIGIVGAGIIGRLIAFFLVNAGHKITLFDKDNDKNCSMAAAGLLNPLSELEKSNWLIYQLGIDALNQHWPNILKHLDKPIYFKSNGSIILSHPRDKPDLLRFISLIQSKIKTVSHPHYQKLDQIHLNQLEPELVKFDLAYYFKEEAHLDNQTLLTELKQYLLNHHVDWLHTTVDEVSCGKLIYQKQQKNFDFVIDCRGLGAKSVFNDLHAIRGELIWLQAPAVNITRPIRFHHPRYSLYLVPRPEHTYIVGASEIQSEDYAEISVRTTLELLTAIYSLHAGFAEARILKTVTHCRPALPDYLPRIKYSDGLIAINGLYRHGFLIGPTIAYDICKWLECSSNHLDYPKIWEKAA